MEKDPVPHTCQGLWNLPGPVLGQETWLLPAPRPWPLGGPAGGASCPTPPQLWSTHPERPLGFSLHGSIPTFPTRRQGGAKQGCSGVEKRASRGETLKVEKIIWRVFCQSPSATRWNFSVTPSTSSVYFYLSCCQVLLLPLGRLLWFALGA